MVTENGVDDAEDRMRPRYIASIFTDVARRQPELAIKGYFHWSLVDNFEWERGWTQRFGLWAGCGYAKEDQASIRGSICAICKENGFPLKWCKNIARNS